TQNSIVIATSADNETPFREISFPVSATIAEREKNTKLETEYFSTLASIALSAINVSVNENLSEFISLNIFPQIFLTVTKQLTPC
ncbi:hypothetical protein CGJ45_24860, partial [Vibrio parahaemolyticus]